MASVQRGPVKGPSCLRAMRCSLRTLSSLFVRYRTLVLWLVNERVNAVRGSGGDHLLPGLMHSCARRCVSAGSYRERVGSDGKDQSPDPPAPIGWRASTGVGARQPPIPPGEYWDRLRAARTAYQLAAESLEIDESPLQSE